MKVWADVQAGDVEVATSEHTANISQASTWRIPVSFDFNSIGKMVRMNVVFIFISSSDPNLLRKKSIKQNIKKTMA